MTCPEAPPVAPPSKQAGQGRGGCGAAGPPLNVPPERAGRGADDSAKRTLDRPATTGGDGRGRRAGHLRRRGATWRSGAHTRGDRPEVGVGAFCDRQSGSDVIWALRLSSRNVGRPGRLHRLGRHFGGKPTTGRQYRGELAKARLRAVCGPAAVVTECCDCPGHRPGRAAFANSMRSGLEPAGLCDTLRDGEGDQAAHGPVAPVGQVTSSPARWRRWPKPTQLLKTPVKAP